MTKNLFASILFWGLGVTVSWAGPIFQPISAFPAGPLGPENGTLLRHSDGFFYGASKSGGAFGNGCIYRVSSTGQVTALVHFTGSAGLVRGRRPQAGLVDDGTGVLWGTTFQGGAGNSGDGFGTVFRFNPATNDFTSVVEFTGTGGFAKGGFPQAGLVPDGAGQLWGTTSAGGAGGHGTVFKVNPSNLVFSTVLDFTGSGGANRGRNPLATLVHDGAGVLWGTTSEGGSGGNGTVFSIDRGTGSLTTRVDFTGTSGNFVGSGPAAALRAGGDGIWWGTTQGGGALGFGTIFSYKVGGGLFTKIAEFTGTGGALPGRAPRSPLAGDGQGNYFGTTNTGGAGNSGTVFRVDGTTLAVSSVQAFTGSAGSTPGMTPHAGLVSDEAGSLWGVTTGGGLAGQGTIYKINALSGLYTPVTDFVRTLGAAPGSNPTAGLMTGPDGLLWGTTESGGAANAGTLYTVNPVTGIMQGVLQFTGVDGPAKGAGPAAELVDDGTGHFWGTTAAGGANDLGVVFKINALTKVYTVVVEFAGPNGRNPSGSLVADGAGHFWGTTSEGGAGLRGSVFKVAIASGLLTTVVHFTGTTGSFPGDGPSAGLTSDGAGNFWGVTYEGGSSNLGTIFKVSASSGAFSSQLSFDGDGSFPGDGPSSGLTMDAGGNLWGVTEYGGSEDFGVVFKINAVTGVFTHVISFTGLEGEQPGAFPKSSLIQDPVGAWYGTTTAGGRADLGTIFKIAPGGGFSTVAVFTGALGTVPGERPQGSFLRHTDGHFYATTSRGGAIQANVPGGNGSVYRLRFGPMVETGEATVIETTTATLNGLVNPNGAASAVTFEYGTSATLAGATVVDAGTTTAVSEMVPASVALSGLLPNKLYYFRIRALNPENANLQTGSIRWFTTKSGTGGGDDGGGGVNSFSKWLLDLGIPGGAAEAGIDSDSDGTSNAVEYIQGTSPVLRTPRMDPTIAIVDGDLVFTFERVDASETPDVTLRVETGTTAEQFLTVYSIGATTETSAARVTIEENGNAPDLIKVRIPLLAERNQFARLRVLITP